LSEGVPVCGGDERCGAGRRCGEQRRGGGRGPERETVIGQASSPEGKDAPAVDAQLRSQLPHHLYTIDSSSSNSGYKYPDLIISLQISKTPYKIFLNIRKLSLLFSPRFLRANFQESFLNSRKKLKKKFN